MKNTRERIKVIFTDDDHDDCSLFADALNETGINHQLKVFNDGLQLLNYLNNEDSEMPHILFLDLNMPFMNGFESLKMIRSNEKFRDITIAIYSTSASEKDQEDTFVSGANVYIKKPNDFSLLKKVLKEVIEVSWQMHAGAIRSDTFFYTAI